MTANHSKHRKTHLERGGKSACGKTGAALQALTVVSIPNVPFVMLKAERREFYLKTVTCMHCIRRRYDL